MNGLSEARKRGHGKHIQRLGRPTDRAEVAPDALRWWIGPGKEDPGDKDDGKDGIHGYMVTIRLIH